MTISVDIEGGRALAAALKALGNDREIKRAIREALRKAAEPVRDKAKALAPKDVRKLEQSIKIKAAKAQPGDVLLEMLVGIDQTVDPPRIVGRKSGRGSYRDPGVAGNSVIQEFGSENMAANPYMRPAADAELPKATDIVIAELGPAIDRAAARIARRG